LHFFFCRFKSPMTPDKWFCRIRLRLVSQPMKFDRMKMLDALSCVGQRLRYPLEVMLACGRWYAAYPLTFRQIEEMSWQLCSASRSALLERAGKWTRPSSRSAGRGNTCTARSITVAFFERDIDLHCVPEKTTIG
jgi:hypothetical protein